MRTFAYKKVGISALLVALFVMLALMMAPRTADAVIVDDPTKGSLDTMQLPDGEYTVNVTLSQKGDVTKSSMAESAFKGTHSLTVANGAYSLNIALGTLYFMDADHFMNELGYYPKYSVSGSAVSTQGDNVNLWRSKAKEGEKATVAVPVEENVNSFAKSLGYIPIILGAPDMPVTPQDAVIVIDWSTLVAVPDESGDDSSSEEPDPSQDEDSDKETPAVNKDALQNTLTSAHAALDASKKTQAAKDALTAAIALAQAVFNDANATQEQVDAARAALQDALNAHNTAADEPTDSDAPSDSNTPSGGTTPSENNQGSQGASQSGLQVGHVYAVPLVFKKGGSSEVSMSDQYFGDAAYVRPLADGRYDVRFTTNRADYILGLTYNGSPVEAYYSSGNTRG